MAATSGTDEPVSGELVSVAHNPDIEMAWAMRAMQHAEVYYKLISSVDPQFLKLTKVDDQIYSEFQKNCEKLKIDVLDPEELKSESAKEKWRPFCCKFNGIVEDFNYGTLLLRDCSQGYTEENRKTPSLPPGYNSLTKKERKKSTMEEKKELTVEENTERGKKGADRINREEKTDKGGEKGEEADKDINKM
uniref:Polysaccharide biosynthesis domain-containing protein n=1 Tax=Saimiri boliviensis boliviensis TaxID=39432 RepID=A0A2K6TY08_SAIBB